MKNIANKLTVFRMILVFPIIIFLSCDFIKYKWVYSFIIFLVASYTDHLDGKLARKQNNITDFGKIMDPLADKLLVISIFTYFVGFKIAPILPVVLMIMREFFVTSMRFLVTTNVGSVIPANIFGKLKTVFQMLTIIIIMCFEIYMEITGKKLDIPVNVLCSLLTWICAVFSVSSGC
ncbi:MAG: CDP-diacylglycerol--glycerol-3-phosphate 3-phosphatidyltransferase, partial [Acutalibacteraceae bacterium]